MRNERLNLYIFYMHSFVYQIQKHSRVSTMYYYEDTSISGTDRMFAKS